MVPFIHSKSVKLQLQYSEDTKHKTDKKKQPMTTPTEYCMRA